MVSLKAEGIQVFSDLLNEPPTFPEAVEKLTDSEEIFSRGARPPTGEISVRARYSVGGGKADR
jgi:hypothetical protein